MVRDIVHEMEYPHPPERVWRAITEPAQIGQWLMKTDFRPVAGARYRMDAKPQPGWRGWVEGEVLEVVPHRRLVYTWEGSPGEVTTVTWELEPTAKGTRLRLRHAGFKGLRGMISRLAMNGGWGKKLLREGIPDVLDGRSVATMH